MLGKEQSWCMIGMNGGCVVGHRQGDEPDFDKVLQFWFVPAI